MSSSLRSGIERHKKACIDKPCHAIDSSRRFQVCQSLEVSLVHLRSAEALEYLKGIMPENKAIGFLSAPRVREMGERPR